MSSGQRSPVDAKTQPQLTRREREVLALVAQGLVNLEIARALSITEGTVKWHLQRIYRKLQVHNRMQAVLRAYEGKLL